jgi:hypothetical protein
MGILKKITSYFIVHYAVNEKNIQFTHEWIYVQKRLEFIKNHQQTPISVDRNALYRNIINQINQPIQYLEFGVFQGKSFKYWLSQVADPNSSFIGFDTFYGLPENWIASKPVGAYTTHGEIPTIHDERGKFLKGLFHDTLPVFIESTDFRKDDQLIINLDADLYSATSFVLSRLLPYLKKNDIIIFDEFGAFLLHEFKAYCDFIEYSGLSLQLIARTEKFSNVAFVVR